VLASVFGHLTRPFSKRSLDVQDAGLDVDVAVLERNPFARPQPSRGGEQHERPVARPDLLGELSDVCP
jgi:hypothetical protein